MILSQEVLNTIKCAIPHKCKKETNALKKCAHCEIGYNFIVNEPKTLKCSHHICKECESKVERGSIDCEMCEEKRDFIGANGAAADMLAQLYLNPLFDELKDKYKKAFDIYDGIL